MQKLNIPEKINVGFKRREGTYNGNLAYIIYFDRTGVLRKEKSWQTWRHQDIDNVIADNVPTEGFVLNKKVGGYKSDWNFRQAYVRVYDPRGYEFEITIPNLIYILENCASSPGKALEGQFVYAWDGTELILLPVNSQAYRDSLDFKKIEVKSISARSYVPGKTYYDKKQEACIYLGRFEWYQFYKYYYSRDDKFETKHGKKCHIFSVINSNEENTYLIDPKIIAEEPTDPIDVGQMIHDYHMSKNGTPVVELIKTKSEKCTGNKLHGNKLWKYRPWEYERYAHDPITNTIDRNKKEKYHNISCITTYSLINGCVKESDQYSYMLHNNDKETISSEEYSKLNDKMVVKLASGATYDC